MNAIIVSVDFSDLLSICLPYNRHHFGRVMVVTTPADTETEKVARANGAETYATEAFYEDGADFNKFRALEEGLDVLGREGWICILDADVLWPEKLPSFNYVPGFLYAPRRRMLENFQEFFCQRGERWIYAVPPEKQWGNYPLHPQSREFAGYSQTFYASDPVLGPPPWHETCYRHAGVADSFFQAKWPDSRKVRPPWEVLHLGPAATNWCGRASPYADGTLPEGAAAKAQKVRDYIRNRGRGAERFRGEKL